MEIPLEGLLHTWYHGRDEDMVMESLDRGLTTSSWLEWLPFAKLENRCNQLFSWTNKVFGPHTG